METSRDRVLKTISHIPPEITPVHIMGFEGIERWLEHFGVKDDATLREKLGLDLQFGRAAYQGLNSRKGLTIWGTKPTIAGYLGDGYSKVKGDYRLAKAETVADIERFAWPNPDDFDYEIARTLLSVVRERARVVGVRYAITPEGIAAEEAARNRGLWLPLICSLFELFGFEDTLLKLYSEPKLIEAAVSHLDAFIVEFSRRLIKATRGVADIFWFGDDFATAQGLMLSPEHWRKYLKPTYKKLFALAKSSGMKVWFHCCGTFRPVLPDLIDIGMDVWETVQVHLPGNEPEVLKREYGRHITFFGAINSQRTLPFGTEEDVRAEVRERIRVLGKGGGYICGADHTILPDVPIANVLALIDEAKKSRP